MLLNIVANVEFHIIAIDEAVYERLSKARAKIQENEMHGNNSRVLLRLDENIVFDVSNILKEGFIDNPPHTYVMELITPLCLYKGKQPIYFEYKEDSYMSYFNRATKKYEQILITANQGGVRQGVHPHINGFYHVFGDFPKCLTFESQWNSIKNILKTDYYLIYQTAHIQ